MNKTDAFLMIERLREAIRALPDDADIFAWRSDINYDTQQQTTEMHLTHPVAWPAVFDGKRYDGWQEKRIAVTPWVYCWWADRSVNDDA